MSSQTYTGRFNTSLLYEQITKAFPHLGHENVDGTWSFSMQIVSCHFEDGQQITTEMVVTVPDDVDVSAIIAAHVDSDPTEDQKIRSMIVQTATSAVGVKLTDLTLAQIKALIACMLYKAGGVDETGTVRPLREWL